jgi:hypothetical protein
MLLARHSHRETTGGNHDNHPREHLARITPGHAAKVGRALTPSVSPSPKCDTWATGGSAPTLRRHLIPAEVIVKLKEYKFPVDAHDPAVKRNKPSSPDS